MGPIELWHWAGSAFSSGEHVILAAALAFQLPAPRIQAEDPGLQVWSTNYVLHTAHEVDEGDGHAVLAPGNQPFPADDPVHLSARDWCQAALQGSARVVRQDGSVLTITYATAEETAVDCGPPLGHARWRTQGRVRFGHSVGPWGDGVRGLHLVPYRTLATDPTQIPTGSLVYVPSARGVRLQTSEGEIVHDGWFFAADVGGAIRGLHIDTFTGSERRVGLPQVTNTANETVDAYVVRDEALARALLRLHE